MNDSVFYESANKQTLTMWCILYVVLSVAYIVDFASGSGSVTFTFLCELLLLCWIPFFVALIVANRKTMKYKYLKDIIACSAGILYAYVMLNSSIEISFVYILPISSKVIIFKNPFFIARVGVVNVLIYVAVLIYKGASGVGLIENDSLYSTVAIQLAALVLCYLSYFFAISHLSNVDGTMLGFLQKRLKQVVTTVDQVKSANTHIIDSSTVLRELAEESKQNSTRVMKSLDELVEKRDVFARKMNKLLDAKCLDEETRLYIEQLIKEGDEVVESIGDARNSIERIVFKYKGTVASVLEIEDTINHLVEDLGNGGFMQLKDVRRGMRMSIIPNNGEEKDMEYTSEVLEATDDTMFIRADGRGKLPSTSRFRPVIYEVRVTVANVLYIWKNIRVFKGEYNGTTCFRMKIETKPQVMNRRKYSRMNMRNACRIVLSDTGQEYDCIVNDISAKGFAFRTKSSEFINFKSRMLSMEIKNFPILEKEMISGYIVRVMPEKDCFIVGCRMPEDRKDIFDFVNDHFEDIQEENILE